MVMNHPKSDEMTQQSKECENKLSSDEESTPAKLGFPKADGIMQFPLSHFPFPPPPITGTSKHLRDDISICQRDKVIIEDWNSDDEDDVSEVKICNPEILLQDHAVVDSGCSSHMTIQQIVIFHTMNATNGGFWHLEVIPKEVK
ncbi:hypothetical protein Tco_1377920 [Tanacetum coccineum]